MTVSIRLGRQFAAGETSSPLFDGAGKAGGYLQKAGDQLASAKISVTVGTGAQATTLATAADWTSFIKAHADTAAKTDAFAATFGITFQDFVNVVDDLAAGDAKDLSVDLSPASALAQSLKLNAAQDDYGAGLLKDASVALGSNAAGPVNAVAFGSPVPSIGPDILATPIASDWQRDRAEQESWADFRIADGARRTFRANIGPHPFIGLHQPKWEDEAALDLVEKFNFPLFPEVSDNADDPANADGTTHFQDRSEMFRDTYFDTRDGALKKAGASVRARVRFDNDDAHTVRRILVQAKEGRSVSGGASSVRKFEQRWENYSSAGQTEDTALAAVVTGKGPDGKVLPVSQKLYQLASDKGVLPDDGLMALTPKYIVLQRRRRAHLWISPVSELTKRQTELKTKVTELETAGTPVDPKLTRYLTKLEAQIALLNRGAEVLKKYGQYNSSGECLIVSADRYSVFDAHARKEVPVDDEDELGRLGQALHVEAEWDSASSDPYEKALKEIDKRREATPAPSAADLATLDADEKALEELRALFLADVDTAVAIQRQRLLDAGLEEEPTRMSKDERAQIFADAPNRPVHWL